VSKEGLLTQAGAKKLMMMMPFICSYKKKKTGSEPGLEGAVGAGSRKEAYV